MAVQAPMSRALQEFLDRAHQVGSAAPLRALLGPHPVTVEVDGNYFRVDTVAGARRLNRRGPCTAGPLFNGKG